MLRSDLLGYLRDFLLLFCWLDYSFWVLSWFGFFGNDWLWSDSVNYRLGTLLYCFSLRCRRSRLRFSFFGGCLFGWSFLRSGLFGSSGDDWDCNYRLWLRFCCLILLCWCFSCRRFLRGCLFRLSRCWWGDWLLFGSRHSSVLCISLISRF